MTTAKTYYVCIGRECMCVRGVEGLRSVIRQTENVYFRKAFQRLLEAWHGEGELSS